MSPSANAEHCIGCGRATRVGTPLFSDRHTGRDEAGLPMHLCADCNDRAVSHYGRRLTDHDMTQIAARAAGLGFAARGGAGPGTGGGG